MACDYDQTRYVLKQGNVISFNLKDVNSDYNLLGFHNNKSVFEYTDEKLNSEPQQKNEDNLKMRIDSNIVSKQIIVKSISSSGRIVLINDKKVVPVKKCTYVPINTLKIISDKKYVTAGNLTKVNTVDCEYLTLTKGMRTYEKKKDKTYQNTNTDNRITKINKDLKAFNLIKEIGDKCTNTSDGVKLQVKKIEKPTEINPVNKITQTSADFNNHKVKAASSNNFVYVKNAVEHPKILNHADKQNLDADTILKTQNAKSMCIKTYCKKKSAIDNSENKVLNTSSQISCIDLTSDISNESENTERDCEEQQLVEVVTLTECDTCNKDEQVKIKSKETVWNPKDNLNLWSSDMGKIKHFKEKSATNGKTSSDSVSKDTNSSTGECNDTKATKMTRREIIIAEPEMGNVTGRWTVPSNIQCHKKMTIDTTQPVKAKYKTLRLSESDLRNKVSSKSFVEETVEYAVPQMQIAQQNLNIRLLSPESDETTTRFPIKKLLKDCDPKEIKLMEPKIAKLRLESSHEPFVEGQMADPFSENGYYPKDNTILYKVLPFKIKNVNVKTQESIENEQNRIKNVEVNNKTTDDKCNIKEIDEISTLESGEFESITIANDKIKKVENEEAGHNEPVTNKISNLNISDDNLSQRVKIRRKQRAKTVNKQLSLRREIEKIIKGTIGPRKKQKTRNVEEKAFKHNSCQATVELSDNSTQTDGEQEQHWTPLATPNTVEMNNLDVMLDEHFDYKNNIIGANVNFGVGPKMKPYSGDAVTCTTGNNLPALSDTSLHIFPSHLDTAMGYGNVNYLTCANGSANVGISDKQVFFEYLKNCCRQDPAGYLPLHLGVLNNNIIEVRRQTLMLNLRNFSIDFPDNNDLTPLHLAIIHNSDEAIIKFLLHAGADLSCTDSDGNTPMHLAVYHNSLTSLKVLLNKANEARFNLNTFNYEGFTPLLLATVEDKYDMVDILLKYGADVNVTDQKSGRTPLFHAVENNSLKLVQLLLENGANKKIKNFSGTSTHDAVFELDNINPEIKNKIIGRELFTVNSTRTDKRRRNTEKAKEEICTKKLKTVKTYRKIKDLYKN